MKLWILLIGLSSSPILFSQDLNISLAHEYEGLPFYYDTTYLHETGVALNFTRVQYYLSSFNLTHDGGQQLAIPDSYVLASGNIASYSVGPCAITTLEGIQFDLGVDSLRNSMGIDQWPISHPLGPKHPDMDWGWPSGYFFFIIDGFVDDTGDGIPNKIFEMRGVGDTLLRTVDISGFSFTGNYINIFVNIADWVKGMDMETMGFEHNAGPILTKIADNTMDETVFTLQSGVTVSTDEIAHEPNVIHADYSLPYAPTLYYSLATENNIDISVFDMNGRLVLKGVDLNHEGNYFIRKELMSGSYIAIFSNNELEERFRFVVQK